MYKFWYEVIEKTCKNPKLLYMDTDSFIFETKEHFRDIMLKNNELYGVSNQPKDIIEYYCPDNKKIPGKMKDEFPGKTIEYIALKPKSYTIITNKTEKCRYKGHSFNFSSNQYKDVLFNKKNTETSNEKSSI